MKKTVSVILCLTVFFSVFTFNIYTLAADEKYYYSDFNSGLSTTPVASGNQNNTVSVLANTGTTYSCSGGALSITMNNGNYLRLKNSAKDFDDYKYMIIRMKGSNSWGTGLTGNAFFVWFGSFSKKGTPLYIEAKNLTADFTDVKIEIPENYFDNLEEEYKFSLIIEANRGATINLTIDEIYFTEKRNQQPPVTPPEEPEEPTDTEEIICTDCDVNSDGFVNILDIIRLKKIFVSGKLCDTDGNGVTNAGDLAFLKQILLGITDLSKRGKIYSDFATTLVKDSFVNSGEKGEKIKLFIAESTDYTQQNGFLNLDMTGAGAYIRFVNTVSLTNTERKAIYKYMVLTVSGYAENSSGVTLTDGNVAKVWFGAWGQEDRATFISAQSINENLYTKLIIPLNDSMFTGIVDDYVSGLFIKSAGAAAVHLSIDEIRFCNNAPSDSGISLGKAKMYNFPYSMTSSTYCNVLVNGENCFVYETNVNNRRLSPGGKASDVLQLEKCEVASFDMSGNINITVDLNGKALNSITVSPKAYGITPTVNDNKATFTISKPGQYTVEFNGSTSRVLNIFANPFESEQITADTPNVIYYGPGEHTVGKITLTANQTLYLAGGAILHGKVVSGGKNIKISGRGYFDNSVYSRYGEDGVTSTPTVPIDLAGCKNVTIDGIACLDPAGWAYNLFNCSSVTLNNIKIITSRQNGDGISLQSCNDVTVKDSFARTWDDSFVVKNYEGLSTSNINFNNCIIWNDLAQAMEIGYETRGDKMTGIHFDNITVLHAFHKAVISVHNGDHAAISDVSFNNITVEDAQMGYIKNSNDGQNYLIDIQVLYSPVWSKENTRGTVSGVTVSNVNVLNGKPQTVFISGYDNSHKVSDVTLQNINILGTKLTSTSSLISKKEFVSNLTVK